jgi:hypothetical protein
MQHKFSKVDMNKFDGSDPTGWVTQMERYFSLHGIIDGLMKLRVGALNLDQEQWKWWQWHKKSYGEYIAWSQFVKSIYADFERHTKYLGWLTKLCQTGTVEDFIAAFNKLEIHTKGMIDSFFKECFISDAKEEIRA